jgi:hypothetical protein
MPLYSPRADRLLRGLWRCVFRRCKTLGPVIVLCVLFATEAAGAQDFAIEAVTAQDFVTKTTFAQDFAAEGESDLPDSPTPSFPMTARVDVGRVDLKLGDSGKTGLGGALVPTPIQVEREPFHWKGLLVQSFSFVLVQNAVRVITANQHDRHVLLNKPYYSDYWASLGQFNMRRWNDGDSIPVNYVGHPMQGAISGYIEVQNDPRGRELRLSRGRPYWNSRFQAFLWETVYSTAWEIGPLGETGVFNQGGFTYPIRCSNNPSADTCDRPDAMYTNNTGWVDFIVTPIAGTLWLIGEDAIDRYVSDPLVQRHPKTFGYKVLRSSLNPTRSMANLLRGKYPWYRDYEHPGEYESQVSRRSEQSTEEEPKKRGEVSVFYSALALSTNQPGCMECRVVTDGAGVEVGFQVLPYMDVVAVGRVQPNASPLSSMNIGGSLVAANFGLRSGYSGRYFAAKISLAPGFASYSQNRPMATVSNPNPAPQRNFNFSALLAVDLDLRVYRGVGFRVAAEQMVIRYKSAVRDPDGIGSPPYLSFLSHDNYINSTNWGVRVGPVFQF